MSGRSEYEEIYFYGLLHFPTLPSKPLLVLQGQPTPDVRSTEHLQVKGGTITNFLNGAPQQHLWILGDGSCVINNNSHIVTTTGANITLANNKIYHFIYFNSVWRQE